MENSKTQIHCATSLSFYYRHFRHCPPTPLLWNSTEQIFYSTKNYKIWLILHIVVFTLITGSASLFVLAYSSHFPLAQVVFSVIIFTCVGMDCTFGFVVYFYYDDIIVAYSAMKRVLEETEHFYNNQNTELKKLDAKWKFISIFLKMTVLSLVPMKWVMPPFLVYHNFDPYYGLNTFYNWRSSYIDVSLRLVFMFIAFVDGLQVYGLTMTSLSLWLEMQSKYLKRLGSSVILEKGDHFFKSYSIFHMVSRIGKDATSETIRIYMGSMFGVTVVCNVITIRYFGQVPFEVFWFLPTVAVINSLLFYMLVPYLTGCLEETKEMIKEKKRRINPQNSGSCLELKWGKMKIRSLRPIAMHCGGTFPLKKHTKSEFLLAIVQRTLDGILI